MKNFAQHVLRRVAPLTHTLTHTLTCALLCALTMPACSNSVSIRTADALAIVRDFQSSDQPIPASVFESAKGIAILHEGSAALIVGGGGGQGVFLKRLSHNLGSDWSAPLAVNTGAMTLGLQAGVQSRDTIIIMNTDNEVSNFLDDGLYGMAEASAVAGPAKSDPHNAGGPVPAAYYYIRTKGVFGGLLVGGVHFSIADKVNHETYGHDVTIGQITNGTAKPPDGTQILWKSLN